MLRPIKLTKFDEMLIDKHNFPHTEESRLVDCIGVHIICGGDVHIHPVSLTHKAIFCLNCQLRIVVPAEVITYADLREFLSKDKIADIQLAFAQEDN